MTMQSRDTHSAPEDEETSTRKRVCKACDRCRLKKSKCDGASPCNRCQSDNAICVFGERKKSHDKIYPKGYVEMLEQQQDKLVNALQELYDRNLNKKGWPGRPLHKTSKGIPLTHDILDGLGLLKLDDQGKHEDFEEDPNVLRQKMIIKEEELAYPTPNTVQSGFSPVSPLESFVPRTFAGEKTFATTRFQPTPPTRSPEDDTSMTFPEPSLNIGSSMNFDPASLQSSSQTWMQTASRYVPGMSYNNYDPALAYNGMDEIQGKGDPCLPMSSWNDDGINPLGLGPMIT